MSCGTKLQGRYYGYFEREELAEKLEREGEHRLAEKVKHEECLDFSERYRAENALERQGMSRYHDYKEESCHCAEEEQEF